MSYFTILFISSVMSMTWNANPDLIKGVDDRPEIEKLNGAWEANYKDGADDCKMVTIISNGFFSTAVYCNSGEQFKGTIGGKMEVYDNHVKKIYEFHTLDPSMVRQKESTNYNINKDVLRFEGMDLDWARIDNGSPGALQGAWLMTGRKRDGEISYRKPGARRTMKILSGSRFQWIAFNDETAEFKGSGGGTYTTVDGKYTEQIKFFSRDSSRVGASLSFDFELEDGSWHHSGLSSKGKPIYEVWSPSEKAMVAP